MVVMRLDNFIVNHQILRWNVQSDGSLGFRWKGFKGSCWWIGPFMRCIWCWNRQTTLNKGTHKLYLWFLFGSNSCFWVYSLLLLFFGVFACQFLFFFFFFFGRWTTLLDGFRDVYLDVDTREYILCILVVIGVASLLFVFWLVKYYSEFVQFLFAG